MSRPLIEAAARDAGVWEDLVQVYGVDKAIEFLTSPQVYLDGETPMALLFTGNRLKVSALVKDIKRFQG